MSEPQRYDLITNYRCGSSIEEMERADDGEWIRWEAVEAEIAALRAQLAESDKVVLDYINAPSVPDAPVFCAHCEHEMARCPKCKKAEWRIKGLKSEVALAAQVITLTVERDAKDRQVAQLYQDTETLRAEREALRTYLAHLPTCATVGNCRKCGGDHRYGADHLMDVAEDDAPCDCGLAALLAPRQGDTT